MGHFSGGRAGILRPRFRLHVAQQALECAGYAPLVFPLPEIRDVQHAPPTFPNHQWPAPRI
jgi:hypothetical protein